MKKYTGNNSYFFMEQFLKLFHEYFRSKTASFHEIESFLARLLILIKKGGLLQLKFGGVGVNIYLWAR